MRQITKDDRTQIYNILAESYIDLVTKGVIGKVERKVVSQKVLDAIEAAVTFEDVYAFLQTLVAHYPAFSTALAKIKGEINKVHEEQVMSHLQSFLKTAST